MIICILKIEKYKLSKELVETKKNLQITSDENSSLNKIIDELKKGEINFSEQFNLQQQEQFQQVVQQIQEQRETNVEILGAWNPKWNK